MSNNNNTSSGGMSFVGVLTLIFVVLKLVGVINWSWVVVLSPLWIALIIDITIFIVIYIFDLW